MSLLHAEKIIGELMECILDEVEEPVVAHEILGDAISLYALDDGSTDLADKIYSQVERYFEAFRKREAYLLRECGYCVCDACHNVQELKLKAIVHAGTAAFTKVRTLQKISGEDIITAHRLLKNSIPSEEYMLLTKPFLDKCQSFDKTDFVEHVEHYDQLGRIHGMVKFFSPVEAAPEKVSRWRKFRVLMKLEGYMLSRIFGKKKNEYKHLSWEKSYVSPPFKK